MFAKHASNYTLKLVAACNVVADLVEFRSQFGKRKMPMGNSVESMIGQA
jgi:hypothetical protein